MSEIDTVPSVVKVLRLAILKKKLGRLTMRLLLLRVLELLYVGAEILVSVKKLRLLRQHPLIYRTRKLLHLASTR